MITDEQTTLLKSILGPESNQPEIDALHARIKRAYVKHRPSEFRVTVGHHDHHRLEPLGLRVGDLVRLEAHTTERYIPVEIISTPATGSHYYRGVITHQLAPGSKYETGDSVFFSEDQVLASAKVLRRAS